MPADPPSSPALRASDADRDRVIELLRAAVADGRLDSAEFDERVDAALAGRTDRAGRRASQDPREARHGAPRWPVDTAAPV